MVPVKRYGTKVPVVNGPGDRRAGAGGSGPGDRAAHAPVPPARRPRADAQRNRARILEAAEAVFAAQGTGAPIDEIARQAGLGVGTLYRHFPTKEALWEAIAHSRLEEILQDVRRRADEGDPGSALFEVLGDVVEQSEAKRDLFAALAGAGIDPKARFRTTVDALHASVAVLLERAQAAGSVRSDVGVDDLLALVSGACSACSSDGFTGASATRLLAVVCDGLRPQGP